MTETITDAAVGAVVEPADPAVETPPRTVRRPLMGQRHSAGSGCSCGSVR
jgi:hypothetical protein